MPEQGAIFTIRGPIRQPPANLEALSRLGGSPGGRVRPSVVTRGRIADAGLTLGSGDDHIDAPVAAPGARKANRANQAAVVTHFEIAGRG